MQTTSSLKLPHASRFAKLEPGGHIRPSPANDTSPHPSCQLRALKLQPLSHAFTEPSLPQPRKRTPIHPSFLLPQSLVLATPSPPVLPPPTAPSLPPSSTPLRLDPTPPPPASCSRRMGLAGVAIRRPGDPSCQPPPDPIKTSSQSPNLATPALRAATSPWMRCQGAAIELKPFFLTVHIAT